MPKIKHDYIGFIFLFSHQLPLKEFSEENKQKYKNKILLHILSYLNYFNKDYSKYITPIVKNNGTMYHILESDYGVKKNYISDYTTLPKKLIKKKDTVIYIILLKSNKKNNIIKSIFNSDNESNNIKINIDNNLLFYDLETIDKESQDIFTSIINYNKSKTLTKYTKNIILVNDLLNEIYEIPLSSIIDSLCGIEELREETKCYI